MRSFLVGILLFITLMCYFAFVNYTEPTEYGFARNLFTGDMWIQKSGKWHATPPWVSVSVIDGRPMRVGISTAGHGYSSKLIQFDPQYWQEFIQVEGFRYWWWANRISINFGYDEEYRGIKDILRGYAYGIKHYPFIKILQEYESK